MQLSVEPSVHETFDPGRMLRASIIIVNYNAKEKLLRCLETVLPTSPPDCEVIIVDNHSSDGIADAIASDFPQVRLIRSKVNLGFAAGNNLGALQAHGKYLVFLNPDTLVEHGWLDALIAPFETNPRAGLVTSKIVLAEQPELINTCGNAVHFTGLTLCRGLGQPREAFGEVQQVDAVSGAAFAMRRDLFETLDGFDKDTFLYMEDTDLSWRARLAGWHCLYAPASVVRHHYSLRISPQKIFYQERNRYLMLVKSLRWPSLLSLVPALLLAEVVTWGFVLYADRANLMNKLRAYAWILRHWPETLRKRKATQSFRQVSDRELLRHTTFRLDLERVSATTVGKLAQLIFNPFFFILRGLAMILIWW